MIELFEGEPIEEWRKIQDAGGVYEDPFPYHPDDQPIPDVTHLSDGTRVYHHGREPTSE